MYCNYFFMKLSKYEYSLYSNIGYLEKIGNRSLLVMC